MLSASIPFPPIGGGKLRTYHLLRALSRRHDLTLIGFTYGEQANEPTFPVRVVAVPWKQPTLYEQMYGPDSVAATRAADLLNRGADEPWCVNWPESAAMEEAIHCLSRDDFDLVLIEGTPMARFLHVLPDAVPRVLDFFDVYTRMNLRRSDSDAAAFEAERTRRFERAAARQCDLCLTVSETEAAAAKDLLGIDHVQVVPNGVDTAYFSPTGSEPEPTFLLYRLHDLSPQQRSRHAFREEHPSLDSRAATKRRHSHRRRRPAASRDGIGRRSRLRPWVRAGPAPVLPSGGSGCRPASLRRRNEDQSARSRRLRKGDCHHFGGR